MADTNEKEGKNAEQKATTPKLAVFHIAKVEGQANPAWTRVGVAFPNRDGSFNLIVNKPLPAGAKLQIREEKARAKPEETPAAAA